MSFEKGLKKQIINTLSHSPGRTAESPPETKWSSRGPQIPGLSKDCSSSSQRIRDLPSAREACVLGRCKNKKSEPGGDENMEKTKGNISKKCFIFKTPQST